MRRLIVGLALGMLMLLPAKAQNQAPDGTIELSGGSVAVGIGYTWGSGKLNYQGKDYALTVKGLSIVDVGASEYNAAGSVYNLKKLEDFDGTYTAGTAGATVAGGMSGTVMRNQNGVAIELTSTHSGLQFTLAPSGMEVHIAK